MSEVRRAVPADAPAIAAVNVAAWQVAYAGLMAHEILAGLDVVDRARRWAERLQSPSASVLVAGEPVCGFAAVGPAHHDRLVGEVYSVYVHPDHWGRGVGRALIVAAEEVLAELGCPDAVLWVLATNERARGFYATQGWVLDGATRTDDGLDQVRLHRSLGR